MAVSRCPVCGERLMYRTRITVDPYAVSSAWVCPVCEQQKKPPRRAAIETGSGWAAVPKRLKEEFDYD